MMAEGSLQDRILRTALLDSIGDALALLQRRQSNEMFQRYLRERSLYALLICAGLLMVRPSRDRIGPLGTVLYVVPKTLIAVAAVGAGAAILGGWGWKIYDPQAFQSFLGQVPHEYVKLLANGWKR